MKLVDYCLSTISGSIYMVGLSYYINEQIQNDKPIDRILVKFSELELWEQKILKETMELLEAAYVEHDLFEYAAKLRDLKAQVFA